MKKIFLYLLSVIFFVGCSNKTSEIVRKCLNDKTCAIYQRISSNTPFGATVDDFYRVIVFKGGKATTLVTGATGMLACDGLEWNSEGFLKIKLRNDRKNSVKINNLPKYCSVVFVDYVEESVESPDRRYRVLKYSVSCDKNNYWLFIRNKQEENYGEWSFEQEVYANTFWDVSGKHSVRYNIPRGFIGETVNDSASIRWIDNNNLEITTRGDVAYIHHKWNGVRIIWKSGNKSTTPGLDSRHNTKKRL